MALWGKTDTANDKPKYLKKDSDKAITFGVNVSEAQVDANRAKGLKSPGWVKYTSYTDGNGNVRHKSETLVAMSAGATVGVMGDSLDDATVPDLAITIGTQPTNTSVIAPAAATFTVVATVNSSEDALTYQWQKAESTANTVFTNIVGATSASYITGATAVASGAGDTNGDKYRVIITAGAATATSSAVTLTVTAS